MKRPWISLTQLVVLAAVPLVIWSNPNAPGKYAGAPNDNGSCASCHGGPGTGSVQIAFPSLTYSPGVAQHLQVVIIDPPALRWGFEVTARQASNPAALQAGTLTALDASTRVLCSDGNPRPAAGCPAATPLEYLGQTATGTFIGQPAVATYSFDWTPPASGAGDVMFFVSAVGANNDNLPGGDRAYTANYTLKPAAGGTLPTMTAAPATLTFNSSGGATPATQSIHIGSSGVALAWTAAATTSSGGTWLTVTPSGTSPSDAIVAVNPTGLGPGTFNGTITVTSAGASNSPKTVGVTLTVSAAGQPSLAVTPQGLTFTYKPGGAVPAAKELSLTNTGTPLTFAWLISTESGGNWMSVSSTGNTTPATVTVSVAPTGLAEGTYKGNLSFTSVGSAISPIVVPVKLVVTNQPEAEVPSLSFHFVAESKEDGGPNVMEIDGSGRFDTASFRGQGNFTIHHPGNRGKASVQSTGKWTMTKLVKFTPGDETVGSHLGGTLVMEADFEPRGGEVMKATITVVGSGFFGEKKNEDSGVTVQFSDGKFVPSDGRATFTDDNSVDGEDEAEAGDDNLGHGNGNGQGNGNGHN